MAGAVRSLLTRQGARRNGPGRLAYGGLRSVSNSWIAQSPLGLSVELLPVANTSRRTPITHVAETTVPVSGNA